MFLSAIYTPLIYINDLPHASDMFGILMYADDPMIQHYSVTLIMCAAKTKNNSELDNIFDWLHYLLELLESSVIGKQNTLVGLFLVTSTVSTTSLVGYSQF